MALPQEDMGPAWLRDWSSKTGFTELDRFSGYVNTGALSVDLNTLVAFADALQKEHENDFRPHVKEVFDQMSAKPADPDSRFVELTDTMTHHRDMLVQTSTALTNHDSAVIAFVNAARAIAKEYGNTDAMASAKVADVEDSFTAPANSSTGGNNNSSTTTPTVVTPEQAAQQTDQPIQTGDNGNDGNDGGSTDNGRDYGA